MDYTIALPSKPKIVFEEGNKGVYEISGLYAGYGHTLGNSLRRIILSSIPGAAVTTVKIDGVSHEFSKITGVKEDVITILLALKKLRFKMNTDEAQTAKISVNGAKTVTGKDIDLPSQIEIMNEDEHIATLTAKDSKLDIEITIEKGLGYVSRDELRKDKVDIGTIVLDAVFTPIRKVNYEVENMRVGDRTDYNKLRISIETDSSIAPAEALQKSVGIMINHLKAIADFQEEEEVKEEKVAAKEEAASEEEAAAPEEEDKEVLKTRVEDLELSSRTMNILTEAGIRTLGGLARKKETDLLELEGVGKKMIQEIRRALGNFGITLK
ncbi:MAG: DNA-directed RNA polymerase subunit alpha [Candidatus Pacebacteria bacterium]|nr:DNA-directed RNA polymerase subunit alpha [Candidatus Paceibacterota bacterium]NUQ57473.1 DNA-directed RNA polymerase subunit alpha [Candidatus Paceibacter sp.]